MGDLVILFVHVIVTLFRLWGPGGIRSVVAESVIVKHQLLILNRSRQRVPNLRASNRFVAGLCGLFIQPAGLIRSAIVLKPITLLNLHQALIK
jgi:putative transposase